MFREDKYLIISDLDGTLLNSKGQLTKSTIDYVKKLKEMGHIFCISTGRPIRGSINIYNQLELDTLMLNYNGAYVSNPSDKEFSPIDMTFSKEIAKEIFKCEKIKKYIANALIEGRNQAYMLHEEPNLDIKTDLREIFHIDTLNGVGDLKNNIDNLKHDVNSILINVDKTNDEDSFDKLVYWIKRICSTLVVREWSVPSVGTILEINSIFANKGMGLKFLSSYYGIPTDKIITFGDGENDMNMLADAKYGFAMKNGSKTAKTVARHITKHTNDEDGVIWEIDYFLKNPD